MIVATPFIAAAAYLLAVGRRIPISAPLGALWLILIWFMTLSTHVMRGFVQDDELYFATNNEIEFLSNRFLWILLNKIVAISTDDVVMHMRVLNLFFILAIYALSLRVFKSFSPIAISLLLSYISCIGTLNVRDPAIILGMLWFLHLRGAATGSLRDQGHALRRTFWPTLFVFMLRPFQIFLMHMSGFRWYYLAIITAIIIAFLQTPIGSAYFYRSAYYVQNFDSAIEYRAKQKDLTHAKPTPFNITYWTLRFAAAPTPWNSLFRVFTDDTYEYGRFDLLIRAFHRNAYYALIFLLAYYFIKRPVLVRQTLRRYDYVIKFCVMFSIIYGLFNFGASHERIKFNLFLMVLFLVDRVRQRIQEQGAERL